MASQASRYSPGTSVAPGLNPGRAPLFWDVKPSKRGEYHTVYVTNDHRVTLYTKVK
jgi:hypothetical protein